MPEKIHSLALYDHYNYEVAAITLFSIFLSVICTIGVNDMPNERSWSNEAIDTKMAVSTSVVLEFQTFKVDFLDLEYVIITTCVQAKGGIV